MRKEIVLKKKEEKKKRKKIRVKLFIASSKYFHRRNRRISLPAKIIL